MFLINFLAHIHCMTRISNTFKISVLTVFSISRHQKSRFPEESTKVNWSSSIVIMVLTRLFTRQYAIGMTPCMNNCSKLHSNSMKWFKMIGRKSLSIAQAALSDHQPSSSFIYAYSWNIKTGRTHYRLNITWNSNILIQINASQIWKLFRKYFWTIKNSSRMLLNGRDVFKMILTKQRNKKRQWTRQRDLDSKDLQSKRPRSWGYKDYSSKKPRDLDCSDFRSRRQRDWDSKKKLRLNDFDLKDLLKKKDSEGKKKKEPGGERRQRLRLSDSFKCSPS